MTRFSLCVTIHLPGKSNCWRDSSNETKWRRNQSIFNISFTRGELQGREKSRPVLFMSCFSRIWHMNCFDTWIFNGLVFWVMKNGNLELKCVFGMRKRIESNLQSGGWTILLLNGWNGFHSHSTLQSLQFQFPFSLNYQTPPYIHVILICSYWSPGAHRNIFQSSSSSQGLQYKGNTWQTSEGHWWKSFYSLSTWTQWISAHRSCQGKCLAILIC